MFKKLLEGAEKIINWIEKDREKQAQKIRDKRAAYLEEKHKRAEAERRKAYKQELSKREALRIQRLSSYTTIEEFKNIIESSQYKNLSDKDRDVFLKRMNELRKQNPQFAEEYKTWQAEKAKKAASIQKFKSSTDHQNIINI